MTQTRSELIGTFAAQRALNSNQNSFTQWTSDNGTVGVSVANAIGLAVQVYWDVTAASAATYALIVDVFTSQDGTHYDTEPYCTMTIGLTASGAQVKMADMPIPYPEVLKNIKVKATTNTLASATSNIWLSLMTVTA